MRSAVLLFVIIVSVAAGFSQDVQKLVDTEHAFAQLAADKDTRTAFLANMTDDAVVFTPEQTNAKAFWEARKPNSSLLSWAPNFADISSNGILGYTTGNWEFRAKGKNDTPSAFGDFITLWLRQPDGKYKWVVDIGVEHPRPDKFILDWIKVEPDVSGNTEKTNPTNELMPEFYQLAASKGLAKAYEKFAYKNIAAYREGKLPILGKKETLKLLKADKSIFSFSKYSSTLTSENLSYTLNTYARTLDGEVVEKGNFLQIWKFHNGKWHIVLDVFKPIP